MAQISPYTRNKVWTDDNDKDDGGSSNDNDVDKQNADWHLSYSR